jgi:hypothetical protein
MLAIQRLVANASDAAMNMMPIGFDLLVLMGLWLAFAGWIVKMPVWPQWSVAITQDPT